MTKFITIGSCLTYSIAFCYRRKFHKSFYIASTRHTRIDKLINTYIKQKDREISYEYVQKLNYNRQDKALAKLVDNQLSSRNLGKTSLNSKSITGLIDTIHNRKFDFIIYDNFIDLLGKLIYSRENHTSFFINTKQASNWEKYFYMEKNKISIDSCVDYYEEMARFLKEKDPHVKIIFTNFPLLHKHESAKKRVSEVNLKYTKNDFLRTNTFFLPAGHISSEYLMNAHHFQEYRGRNLYEDYASIVNLIVGGRYSCSEWNELVKGKENSLLDCANFYRLAIAPNCGLD